MKGKTYKIKIPVYSSELFEESQGLFENHSYTDMINFLDNKLADFKNNKPKLSIRKRNKFKEVEIQNIEKIDCVIGKIPAVIFKISAYNTNLLDGFVETETKINLKRKDKLGSETNFLLLYPIIKSIESSSYEYQWKILLYEDPTKENSELVSISKLVLDKVFNIKICNIKLDRVLKELKKKKNIKELSLQFFSLTYDENEVDSYMTEYLVNSSLKKQKHENYKNVPFEKVEKLIRDTDYEQSYQKRIIKFHQNSKEIKLTNEYEEAKDKIKNTFEEIFNSNVDIKENDIDSLFKTDFIIKKMIPVLKEYLCENE